MAGKKPSRSSRVTRREFLAGSLAVASGFSRTDLSAADVQNVPLKPDATSPFTFPKDFLWGAASSAYQIEGAAAADGKGPSIWDDFCKRPGAIVGGQSGETACDHYHRYREDVALMKQIGLRAYRFSISWPRVIPQGTGGVNPKGLDFYSRLVDELLRAGVTPFATLYHWDFPLALQRRGGWLERDSARWFAVYATELARALSDRVKFWLTINEPRSFIGSAYVSGEHAPGEKLPLAQALRAGHNLMRAHGLAVQAIRAAAKQPVQVGYAPDCSPSLPLPENSQNIAAARDATFAMPRDYFNIGNWWRANSWWIDPVLRGEYPADGVAALGADAPQIVAGDMREIQQPLDFFAVNIYGGHPVRAKESGGFEFAAWPQGWPTTAFGWAVTPDAMYWGPKWLYERYKLPILITENGLSCHDWISLDGAVHDPQRIDFVSRYLQSLARAMREGVPVLGYFYWSLLDNFEWAAGYRQRFGMIYVDYPTQRRVLKDSAVWYGERIRSNQLSW